MRALAKALFALGAGTIYLGTCAAAPPTSSYICVADLVTGFKFNKNSQKWIQANFDASASRYILRPSQEHPGNFVLLDFGRSDDERLGTLCGAFSELLMTLSCETAGGALYFGFDARSGRFIYSELLGYAFPYTSDATPFVAIGKCSTI